MFLPFNEKVDPSEYRDRGLIESAAARPFQRFGGVDLIPTVPGKAACLFHSLTSNHCFINGNKRTAVIALDMFLTMNGHVLTMTPTEVYSMAIKTTEANRDGRKLDDVMAELTARLTAEAVPLTAFADKDFAEKFKDKDQRQKVITHVIRMVKFTFGLLEAFNPHNGRTSRHEKCVEQD